MAEDKTIAGQVAKGLDVVAGGFHAIPDSRHPVRRLPARHRLYNALGMAVGFSAVKYIGDILYGHKINGSQYEEIRKTDVPWVLRPLHGRIKTNPFSDKVSDEKRTIVHKLLPAFGGALGAISGSAYFFMDGTSKAIRGLIKEQKTGKTMTPAQISIIKTYKQGILWRVGTGTTAWFSSTAAPLTGALYGVFINQSFRLINSTKKLLGQGTKEQLSNPGTKPITGKKWANVMAMTQIVALIGGLGALAVKVAKKKEKAGTSVPEDKDLSKISAEQYVNAIDNKYNAEKKKSKVLQFFGWMGNAGLAVVPVHRIWSAIGLTAFGGLGLYMARVLRGGQILKENPIEIPQIFKTVKLAGLLAPKPGNSELKNQFLKLGGLYTFAAFCATGAMVGSRYAYAYVRKRNAHPHSIEDYNARVRQHYGDSFIPMIGLTGIFGSAAFTYLIPPAAYGNWLWPRVIFEQDRNVTTPGLEKLTGNTTNSYFSMREGLDYLCKYAVHNEAEHPERFEFLAYTIMGPIANAAHVKLTGENVKQFVDKLDDIRSKYWKEGGVPGYLQDDLEKELKETFTGKGLDKTLYDCGIDSLNIQFTETGGLLGKFANTMGARKKVAAEEKACREMIGKWREGWEAAPDKSKEENIPETIISAEITPEERAVIDEHEQEEEVRNVEMDNPRQPKVASDYDSFMDMVEGSGLSRAEAKRIEKTATAEEKPFTERTEHTSIKDRAGKAPPDSFENMALNPEASLTSNRAY